MQLNHSSLHYYIISSIVRQGYAPKISQIAQHFATTEDSVVTALKALEQYHGVVLHPTSSEVWIMHPFSTAPTNFWIESANGSWWGNCAWCSLGAAALLKQDLTITHMSLPPVNR